MKYFSKKDNSSEMSQFIKSDGVFNTHVFFIDNYICQIRKHKGDLPYPKDYIDNEFQECEKSEFDNALNKALEILTYELL